VGLRVNSRVECRLLGFDLPYAFVIVRLDRRDLVWINVTPQPTAEWVARQITEAFPWNEAPRYTVRDRDRSEKISQAPASFHVIARGRAGPSLLAMVLFEKFDQHQPLNRQAERYAKEGVPLGLSTLADQVGGCTAALVPLVHVPRGLRAKCRAIAWRRHQGAGSKARPTPAGSGFTKPT